MRNQVGIKGEQLAVEYLERLGHQILHKNYSCRFGEVDIISKYGAYYHFHEVKTIYHTNYHPLEQITAKKLRKFVKTTEYYIKSNYLGDIDFSINAIGIILSEDAPPKYYYEENITL